jgi:hypothetical protein
MGQIHATVGPVSQERFHIELTEANKISFTKLNQLAKVCDALPGSVKQFT